MKLQRHRRGALTIALGAVLMLLGALALNAAGDTLQYAFPAPQATKDGGELTAVYEQAQAQLASVADSLSAYAVAARRQGASLSGGAGRSAEVTIYAVGEGYFDVMHETLQNGRFISAADVSRADEVVVVEEKSALALFPGVDPVGQTLTIDGVTYEVAGVIAGGRKLGESDEAVAYIPITTAGKQAMEMQTVACVALGADDTTGPAILMEDTLSAWRSGGSFYSMPKLRLRAATPLIWTVIIAGAAALLAALQRMNAWAARRICGYRERLRTRYAREMALSIAGDLLLAAMLYGLWALLLSRLAVFAVEPLYVLTEWIPEVIVELSSLEERFWALQSASSAAVRCVTRESCVIELGQGLLRWGLTAVLLGLAMRASRWLSGDA